VTLVQAGASPVGHPNHPAGTGGFITARGSVAIRGSYPQTAWRNTRTRDQDLPHDGRGTARNAVSTGLDSRVGLKSAPPWSPTDVAQL